MESAGAEVSCQDMAISSMEGVELRGKILGWHPSGLLMAYYGCSAATADTSLENCVMQKSIEDLFFVFPWHCLMYKEGHNQESLIS